RPGMSVADFRDDYETRHRVLAEKYMASGERYVRRYLEPAPGDAEELPFDVITELWFDDRAVAEKVVEITSQVRLPTDIIADEERLFDRARSRVAMVVEYDSDMAAIAKART